MDFEIQDSGIWYNAVAQLVVLERETERKQSCEVCDGDLLH